MILPLVSRKCSDYNPATRLKLEELNKAKKEVDYHLRLTPEIRNALDQAKFQRET